MKRVDGSSSKLGEFWKVARIPVAAVGTVALGGGIALALNNSDEHLPQLTATSAEVVAHQTVPAYTVEISGALVREPKVYDLIVSQHEPDKTCADAQGNEEFIVPVSVTEYKQITDGTTLMPTAGEITDARDYYVC